MNTIKVLEHKGSDITLPQYETIGSAGADVRAVIPHPITLQPMQRYAVPTNLFVEIPIGYEIQVRPRSGLAYKYGLTVLNTPGTIDSDYRGEIKVILINLGDKEYTINNGDRIAQLVVSPVTQMKYEFTDTIGESERGEGGFGSTGKH